MRDYRVTYRSDGGDVLAVFLDSAADCGTGSLMVYAPAGEHSEADAAWALALPPAAEADYGPLHEYLARRYADPGQGTPLHLVIEN